MSLLELQSEFTDTTFHATQLSHRLTNFDSIQSKFDFLKSDLCFLLQTYGLADGNYDVAKERADEIIALLHGKPLTKRMWNIFDQDDNLQAVVEVFDTTDPLEYYAACRRYLRTDELKRLGYRYELA